jgi:hypothetical protein
MIRNGMATLLAWVVSIGLGTGPAVVTAAPRPTKPIRVRELSASQVGSRLYLSYAIDPRQWRRGMAQLVLHISARSHARRRPASTVHLQQALTKPRGRLDFGLPEGAGRMRATVWLTRASATRDDAAPLLIGSVHARRVELAVSWTPGRLPDPAVTRPPLPPPAAPLARPDWTRRREVARACEIAFDGARNEAACMDAAARSPFHPVVMIQACERAMDGDTNELYCLELAVRAAEERSQALAACDRAMDGDANELKCLRAVVTARFEPSAAIEACDSAMDGDANELACVQVAVTFRGDPAAAIRACDEKTTGDREALECVRRAVR